MSLELFKKKIDLNPDEALIGVDSKDIIDQINNNGYAFLSAKVISEIVEEKKSF